MAKKALLVLFSVECLVLSVLLAREWTRFYMRGPSERAYASVYADKLDAGHASLTAEIDAGTTSFAIWWGGVILLLIGLPTGGYVWAQRTLWPVSIANSDRLNEHRGV